MIHDILLSCLSISCKGQGIRTFLASKAVDEFLHPGERSLYMEILNMLYNLDEVVRFARHFTGKITDFEDAYEYSSGCYLKCFALGIESALEDFYNEIVRLEDYFENKSTNSLSYFYMSLNRHYPIILVLRQLIADVKMQKLHGCTLVAALNLRFEQADINISHIIAKVARPVKLAFFSHLAQWLLFGTIDDPHSEFFITYRSSAENNEKSSTRHSITNMSISEEVIWQYEIDMSLVPEFVSETVAEQILFVGQTVLVFQLDQGQSKNGAKKGALYRDNVGELWEDNEARFFQMVEDLNEAGKIDVNRLKTILIEMKEFVSDRLSAKAIIEDDLYSHMGLIKDFYLLGRGDFYFQFLRQLDGTLEDYPKDNTKKYLRAFKMASICLGITDDLEHFSLTIDQAPLDFDESCQFTLMNNLQLKYIYKWPWTILFSPTIVERYNTIFQFLLIVHKLQYDLQLVWTRHKWIGKTESSVHVKILSFRNLLMFFMDNFQNYIQIEVLESLFSTFISVIKTSSDFEEVRRAHSIFLANALSQCFLLTDQNINITQTKYYSSYSIYGTILDIFRICEKFSLRESSYAEHDDDLKDIEKLEERFNDAILALLKLLIKLKSTPSFGALSQFLLRLDYNLWFSAKLQLASSSSGSQNL